MPIIKPIRGSYFLKPMHPSLYRAAVSLECFSCEHFWNETDISKMMKNSRINGWVIASAMTPIGYVVFEKFKAVVQILNLVVHPDHRRKGMGTVLVERVISRFTATHNSVTMNVRETNLAAQLFLQNLGFVAEAVDRGHFEDHYAEEVDIEDAYCFRKKLISDTQI